MGNYEQAIAEFLDHQAATLIDPNLYEYREPINLSNSRLRKLAAAVNGPARKATAKTVFSKAASYGNPGDSGNGR